MYKTLFEINKNAIEHFINIIYMIGAICGFTMKPNNVLHIYLKIWIVPLYIKKFECPTADYT